MFSHCSLSFLLWCCGNAWERATCHQIHMASCKPTGLCFETIGHSGQSVGQKSSRDPGFNDPHAGTIWDATGQSSTTQM